jgi:hypothetical protein
LRQFFGWVSSEPSDNGRATGRAHPHYRAYSEAVLPAVVYPDERAFAETILKMPRQDFDGYDRIPDD